MQEALDYDAVGPSRNYSFKNWLAANFSRGDSGDLTLIKVILGSQKLWEGPNPWLSLNYNTDLAKYHMEMLVSCEKIFKWVKLNALFLYTQD